MKRVLLVVLAGMILAASAFAGGQNAASAEDPMTGELRVTVQAWMLDRYDFQKIKADFEARHPGVTVVLNRVDTADVTTNMLQWAQGKTDCDIAIGGSREHAVQYAARNFIVPFEDNWFSGNFSKDKWFPAFLELGNVEGTQYMIPFTGEVMFIVANKQLMKNAGIPDANGNIPAPKDWNELYNYAKAATIVEGGRLRQTGLSIDWGANFMVYSYLSALQGIKGDFYEADKETIDFNSPQARELLSQWTRLVKDGYTPTDTFADMDAGRSNFKAGKVAMLLTAASRWIECQANVGEGNTTVIPIPGTEKNGSLVYIHGVVIPRASPKIELAKIFIKEALLNDDLHQTALNKNGKMSPLSRHYANLQNPDWPIVVKATQTAVTTPLYKDFSKLDNTMQAELQKCIAGSQSIPDTQKRLSDFIKTLDLSSGLK
jgi:ABC-type glycerol-3-phosphate transport system substrate-binding protein